MDIAWVLVPLAYLVGTFPTAQLMGRFVGVDPTAEGSGNPGASNMTRVAGRWAGALVLIGDVLKSAVPTLVGLAAGGRPLAAACGAAAVVGHIFPFQRRLRGGKGVATSAGMTLVLWPLIGLVSFVAWLVLVRVTHRASVGSMVVAVLIPALIVVSGRPAWEAAVAAAVAALVLLRHWSNVVRLVHKQETVI